MVASILSDLALNIGALAALVAAGTSTLAVLRGRRMEAKVRDVAIVVDGIDHATNQQPAGSPNLPVRLDRIEAQLGEFWHADRLEAEFASIHQRLDTMAASAARHHPEDP